MILAVIMPIGLVVVVGLLVKLALKYFDERRNNAR